MQLPPSTMANSVPMVVVTHVYPQQGAQNEVLGQAGAAPPATSLFGKFLKGEPAILGTVEIMTGLVILLLGIVMGFQLLPSTYSGIVFWGPLIYITAGSLTVAASKKLNKCLIRASLGLNIISSVAAGLAIIFHSVDFIVPIYPYYDCYDRLHGPGRTWIMGTTGVMLVLTFLEFIVSICVSAFACKVTCRSDTQQVVYISAQVPPSHGASVSTPPLNTSEMLLLSTAVVPPVDHSSDWKSGKSDDLPPEYTATQE